MNRLFALLLVLAPLAVFAFAACTANLEEGCLSGPCAPPGFLPDPTTGSGCDTGGMGGMGSTGGSGGDGGSTCMDKPDGGEIPCEVFAVLKNKCHGCHTSPPQGGAPFPLLTYADTQVTPDGGQPRWQRMAEAVSTGFMPAAGKLTCSQKQVLLDWLNACAVPVPAGMGCE